MATFRYSLQSTPEARNDGSGMVAHVITAQYQDGDWFDVPGRINKTFNVPAADLAVVMAMPDGTAGEKAAKNTAYKTLLVANVNTQNNPNTGWSTVQLQAMIDDNTASTAQAAAADDYITVTLGLSYPVPFAL